MLRTGYLDARDDTTVGKLSDGRTGEEKEGRKEALGNWGGWLLGKGEKYLVGRGQFRWGLRLKKYAASLNGCAPATGRHAGHKIVAAKERG